MSTTQESQKDIAAAEARIQGLEGELGHAYAKLGHERRLHMEARDELARLDALVTHDGCGSVAARVTCEILMGRKASTT